MTLAPKPRRARGRRFAPLLAVLLVAPVALAACGQGTDSAPGAHAPTITLYNAQHAQTTDAMIAAFTKRTGIQVRVKNGDEDVFTAQIEQEGNRSPADVFYSENSNWLQQLDNKGLLAKVDAATLANVPKVDSATNGDWVGVSARVSVLVYNPQKIRASALPTSVLAMANPRYKGEFEIAPAETDFWPIVSSVARAKGNAAALSWLKALEAHASNASVPDNETLTSDVSEGVTDFALINSYYFYRLQAEAQKGSVSAKLAYFAPHDPGYVEDISGAAILKSSTHETAAQKFVAFMTGKRGQEVLAHSDSFEYPIHPGVAPDPRLTPLDRLQPANFTPAELGTGMNAKALLQAAGLI